jgi:hypothetical protein
MTDRYYKIYPAFTKFAQEISNLDLENESEYVISGRDDIYDRLRLPIKFFKGSKKDKIHMLIEKYFGKGDYVFSIIGSEGASRIHTDTYYKKGKHLQRYCNLAFPIKGNMSNRITYWPSLDKQDSLYVFRNSFVDDNNLNKYLDKTTWADSITHKQYQPVLLNTEFPHGVIGEGYTLFAYITIVGKSYDDCIALYDSISNSATI